MPTDTILTWPDYQDEPRSNPAYTLPRGVTDYGDYLRHYYQQVQGQPAPSVPTGALPEAVAEVNCGRWIWQCPACGTGLPLQGGNSVICPTCGTGGWHEVGWPANLGDIEAELLKQPGRRLIAPVRMWKPGWTMEDLKDRTQAAALLVAQGTRMVRALSIGATRTWTLAEIPTATNFNNHISGPIDDLSGDNGEIQLRDSLRVLDGSGGGRYVGLPAGTTTQRPGTPADGTLRWKHHRRGHRCPGERGLAANVGLDCGDLRQPEHQRRGGHGVRAGGRGQGAGGIHTHTAHPVDWDTFSMGSTTLTTSFATIHSFTIPSGSHFAVWRMTGSYSNQSRIIFELKIGSTVVFTGRYEYQIINKPYYLGEVSSTSFTLRARTIHTSYNNSMVSNLRRFEAT